MTVPSVDASTVDGDFDLGELAGARRLCDWMFDQFRDTARGCVAETGAGIGTFSERLLANGVHELVLTEAEPRLAALLEQRFETDERVSVACEALPESPTLRRRAGHFDMVLCQNVLEHVEDDYAAVATMAAALRPGGRLALLVPAHPRLFGSLDRSFGHHRRYTRRRLLDLARGADLEVRELYSFNLLGVPGWWVKGRRRADGLGSASLAVYEQLVRVWRPLEERLRPPWGLSLILQADRPSRPPGRSGSAPAASGPSDRRAR
ncbi:MAG: class I SAM-dependent methyltransferase [Thermoleophilaceae bacterium]